MNYVTLRICHFKISDGHKIQILNICENVNKLSVKNLIKQELYNVLEIVGFMFMIKTK